MTAGRKAHLPNYKAHAAPLFEKDALVLRLSSSAAGDDLSEPCESL